ncbi:MAG: tyrosine-type recombinase/integrase [Patescibacteria group bacterium]|nr:tyrosine-type recombinase/integrase [Patescibacteria group bacterium]
MGVRKIKKSWWVDFQHDLRRIRKRSPSNSKIGAQEYEALLRRRLANGEDIERESTLGEDVLFRDFAREWFETSAKAANKPSEIRTKESILRNHLDPFFGQVELGLIDSKLTEEYKASKLSMKLSKKTVNNHLTILSRCLRVAHEWGKLEKLPKIVKLKAESQRFDFLSPVESVSLVQNCDEPKWREMIFMALRTGMRLGELFGLEWSDVDFDRKLICVRHSIVRGIKGTPKNNKIRFIPITDELCRMIYERRQGKGLVFHRGDGTPLSYKIAENAIHRACKKAKIRLIGWHVLRHTFASQLVSEGVPLNTVQELMGHSSIIMTMRYAHLAPSALKSAVEVLEKAEKREAFKICQPGVNLESLLAKIEICPK